MKVVVRKGHSIRYSGQETVDGKLVRANRVSASEGEVVDLPKEEALRLIEKGVATEPDTEEARTAKEAADALPSGFPGHDALVEAGHSTLSAVRGLTKDQLVDIEGIGDATADKILAAAASE